MKLPFDLGIKLIFRLLVPGFLLTLGLYPALATIREKIGWTINTEYLVVLSAILTGWLILTLDQPIYMFLEGRRFWPKWARVLLIRTERRRLEKLIRADNKFYGLSEISDGNKKQNYRQRHVEASVEERKFPLDKRGEPEAKFPTRLGNLVAAYETYPDTRYGMDAVFYWYRIWLQLDKDLREELDNRQAVADSSIYASVALFADSLLWFVYYVLSKLENPPIAHIPKAPSWWIPLAFLIFSYLLYRASLYPQTQYGESFKSVFDTYEKQVDVQRILGRVADVTHRPAALNEDRRSQLKIAWRYLHNYRVKCVAPACAFRDPMSPEVFEEHYQKHHESKGLGIEASQPDLITYRGSLVSAYNCERYLRIVKSLNAVLGVGLLSAFGVYRSIWFAIAAIAVSLVTWISEILIRKGQEKSIVSMNDIEVKNELPQIYIKLSGYWRNPRIFLPHLIIVFFGLVLLTLRLVGMLP